MAEKLKFVIEHYPDRYYLCQQVEQSTMEEIYKVWKKNTPDKKGEAVSITYAKDSDSSYEEMDSWVGDACDQAACLPEKGGIIMAEGKYLAARITLTSTLGYFSAWEALGKYLMQQGLEPDNDAPALEIIHNPSAMFAPVDMTISVRLNDTQAD